jgi:tagaturonate reductase
MDSLNSKIVKKSVAPIKIMQFGEGNFLRAFVDWIVQKMNDSKKYQGHVVVVQPLQFGRVADLQAQDGLYTLYLQGLDNGKVVRTHEVIDVLDDFINPYSEYQKFLDYAASKDLEVVISNTTEAGITLDESDVDYTSTPKTFPGKVLAMLEHRYQVYQGDMSKGLSFICCELIDNNGKELKKCVLALAKIKNLSSDFIAWIENACHFTSTLVDRIVPGYPRDEIEEITKELGYVDSSIVKGEIFHLWVLDKEPHIQKIFPCDQVGLNVIYADSIKPYKQRKVKILNGCHTCIVPVSYLSGIDTVRETIENPVIGKFARDFVFDEVVPTIELPHDQMVSFANSVFERYLNPFVRHELMSIALNSISKYKARVLPTVKDYLHINNVLPAHAMFSLACLIKFYFGKRGEENIALKDDPAYLTYFEALKAKNLSEKEIVTDVLSQVSMWGEDLNKLANMNEVVTAYLVMINEKGVKEAVASFVGA